MPGVRVANTRRYHLYAMVELSGARVVRVLCVCVDAPCYWAAEVCVGDAFECARSWLTPLGIAAHEHFLLPMMLKKRD